jgi:hypothetical protein
MAAKKRNPNGSGNITQRKDGRYELKVVRRQSGRPPETNQRLCLDLGGR